MYNAIEHIHHKAFNQYHKSKLLKSSLFYKEQSRTNLDSFCFILSFPWAKKGNGGAKRDRTADLLRARQALSQLSYSPILSESLFWLINRHPFFSNTRRRNMKHTLVCEYFDNAVVGKNWWVWADLNSRPHPYQGCALTNWATDPC